jgi:hypothetical protein
MSYGWKVAVVAALLASPALAQSEPQTELETRVETEPQAQQKLSRLRNLNEHQPLRIQDADPQQPGVQAQASLATGDGTGQDGLLLRPRLSVGLPFNVELGAQMEVGTLEGQAQVGPVQGYVQAQLVQEGTVVPGIGVQGAVITRTEQVGVAGELSALATKTFGLSRAHLNASWRAQNEAGDRFLVGVGADHAIRENVLLMGEAFVEPMRDQNSTTLGADVGAGWLVGDNLMLQGALGVRRAGADFDPIVLIRLIVG